jgi:hypothetical protein
VRVDSSKNGFSIFLLAFIGSPSHRLFEGDREQQRTLLTETAITPGDDETLLEPFVSFRFIATLEEINGTSAQFETIKPGRQ